MEGFKRFACLPHLCGATKMESYNSAVTFLPWSAFNPLEPGDKRKACCGVIEQCSCVMANYMMICKACPVKRLGFVSLSSYKYHRRAASLPRNMNRYPTLNSWMGHFVDFKLYAHLSAIARARGLTACMSYRSVLIIETLMEM